MRLSWSFNFLCIWVFDPFSQKMEYNSFWIWRKWEIDVSVLFYNSTVTLKQSGHDICCRFYPVEFINKNKNKSNFLGFQTIIIFYVFDQKYLIYLVLYLLEVCGTKKRGLIWLYCSVSLIIHLTIDTCQDPRNWMSFSYRNLQQ